MRPATKKDRRSQRSLHKSFVTEPFRKTIIQWAMRRVLKLALDDRDKVSAQHEDSEKSSSGTQDWTDLEVEEDTSATPYKWTPADAKPQVDLA